jgi:hypothetical protein
MPEAYLAVNPVLAQRLNALEGQPIEITWKNNTVRLPLRLEPSLPVEVVGLPAGFPSIPAFLPAWAKLVPSMEGDEG